MFEYFNELESLHRTFWYIALASSIFFTGQTIMTFIGVDSGDGLDADFDGDLDGGDSSFQIFSLRNLINFLLGFSWTGVSFYDDIPNHTLLIALATFVGVLFVLAFFVIIKQIRKLAEDNSFKFEHCLNKTAEIYLKVPASKGGKGKVLINVNGSAHELSAITEDSEDIPTGALVKVLAIESGELLLVSKI